MRRLSAFIVLSIALTWSAAAVAAPRGAIEGDPKRSYGAIDVVMYQTSW